MLSRILLALLVSSCGAIDKDKDGVLDELDRKDYEVTRINIEPFEYTRHVNIHVSAELTEGFNVALTDYKLVASISDNGTAPATCDASSKLDALGLINFEELKYNVKYLIRACVYDSVENNYSPGLVAEYVKEKPPIDVIKIKPNLSCYQTMDKCDLYVSADLTGGASYYEANASLVVAMSKEKFPDTCDSISAVGDFSVKLDLLLATTYYLRVCLFDKETKAFSPGMTLELKTDPVEP